MVVDSNNDALTTPPLTPLDEFRHVRETRRQANAERYAKQRHYVSVGDFTYGNPLVRGWGRQPPVLRIGKFCSMAAGVIFLLNGDHRADWATTFPFSSFMKSFSHVKGHPGTKGPITIGNDVWIGTNALIMSGVTVGDGAVIAADALVTKDVPPYTIVGGVPAKAIRARFDQETISRLHEMQWWDWTDEQIVAAIPLLQSDHFDDLWQFYLDNVKGEDRPT